MLINADCAPLQTVNVIAGLAFSAFRSGIVVLKAILNGLLLIANVSVEEGKVADLASFALVGEGLRVGAAETDIEVLHTPSGVGVLGRGSNGDRVIAVVAPGANSGVCVSLAVLNFALEAPITKIGLSCRCKVEAILAKGAT